MPAVCDYFALPFFSCEPNVASLEMLVTSAFIRDVMIIQGNYSGSDTTLRAPRTKDFGTAEVFNPPSSLSYISRPQLYSFNVSLSFHCSNTLSLFIQFCVPLDRKGRF